MATFGPYTFDASGDSDFDDWNFAGPIQPATFPTGNTNRAWSFDTNDTPSGAVGPTSGQGGDPDGYVYTEASQAADNAKWYMTHRRFFDADDPLTLEYYWSARGNDVEATLEVQTIGEGDNGWTTRQTIDLTAEADASGTDPATWNQENVDIGAVVSGPSVGIRIKITFDDNLTNNFHNDVGIDSVTIVGTEDEAPLGTWIRMPIFGGLLPEPDTASPFLTLAVATESAGGAPTSPTYGGQALTQQITAAVGGGFEARVTFLTLDATGVGNATSEAISLSFSDQPDDGSLWARWDENVDSVADTDSTTNGAGLVGATSVEGLEDGVTFAVLCIGAQEVTVTPTGVTARDEAFTGSIGQASNAIFDADASADGTVNVSFAADVGTANRSSVALMHLERTPAAGGTNVAVGLSSETDTAQSIGIQRILAVGLASETDTAQTISPVTETIVAVGLSTETDTAQAITIERRVQVGLSEETDTAQAITIERRVDVGFSSETDTAQPITITRQASVGLASETDTAQPVTIERRVQVGLASETDTALDASPVGQGVVAVGLASETDSAQTITGQRILDVGQSEETDTAQPITITGPATVAVGLTAETDSTFPVSLSRALGLDLAEEADTAQAVTFRRELLLGLASEVDTAQPIDALGTRFLQIGQSDETDTGLPVTPVGGVAVATRDRGAGSGASASQSRRSAVHVRDFIQRQRKDEEELIMELLEEVD